MLIFRLHIETSNHGLKTTGQSRKTKNKNKTIWCNVNQSNHPPKQLLGGHVVHENYGREMKTMEEYSLDIT